MMMMVLFTSHHHHFFPVVEIFLKWNGVCPEWNKAGRLCSMSIFLHKGHTPLEPFTAVISYLFFFWYVFIKWKNKSGGSSTSNITTLNQNPNCPETHKGTWCRGNDDGRRLQQQKLRQQIFCDDDGTIFCYSLGAIMIVLVEKWRRTEKRMMRGKKTFSVQNTFMMYPSIFSI